MNATRFLKGLSNKLSQCTHNKRLKSEQKQLALFRTSTIIANYFCALTAAFKESELKPVVVTLCGSTKFKDEFIKANADETMAGKIVLSVGGFDHAEGVTLTDSQREMLGKLHEHKIDMSDEILVINVDGYIGKSTRHEIEYARQRGIKVRFLEQ